MSKSERYLSLLGQMAALLAEDDDFIARLANASALIKSAFPEFSWVGFYLEKKGSLILGPFQGLPACVRISWGKGVCGTAASLAETIIVPDVRLFPGHIACDAGSLSEIVVPLVRDARVIGVLDIDSHELHTFDEEDGRYLTILADLILGVAEDHA